MYFLLGTELSYYTGKARAFLRYKGVEYQEVLGRSQIYKDFIIPETGVSFVPVLVAPKTDGIKVPTSESFQCIQDSTDIIDFIEQRHPEPQVIPTSPKQRFVSLLLEFWADQWLVIPGMHFRWNFDENLPYVYYEFGRSSTGSKVAKECVEVGRKVCKQFQNSMAFLGISETTGPVIEEQFYQLLEDLATHLSQHSYLLGETPSLADFALMGPLYAHGLRDPRTSVIIKTRAPSVADYIERVMQLVDARDPPHALSRHEPNKPLFIRQRPLGSKGWMPGDGIPDTLTPFLKTIFRDFLPFVSATAREVTRYLKENPSQSTLPRAVGFHSFSLDGVEDARAVLPYDLWMYQRCHDFRAALSEVDRSDLDYWLCQKVCQDAIHTLDSIDLSHCRVRKIGNLMGVEDHSTMEMSRARL